MLGAFLWHMSTILITGGSGLIGSALTKALLKEGHSVRWLSRAAGDRNRVMAFAWHVDKGTMDPSALDGVDHIIHLAGAGIADKRWTDARKKELEQSRAESARLLLRTAKAQSFAPKSFIMGSPAKVVREVSAKDLEWIAKSWRTYVETMNGYR